MKNVITTQRALWVLTENISRVPVVWALFRLLILGVQQVTIAALTLLVWLKRARRLFA
jgi:hypothetical protein